MSCFFDSLGTYMVSAFLHHLQLLKGKGRLSQLHQLLDAGATCDSKMVQENSCVADYACEWGKCFVSGSDGSIYAVTDKMAGTAHGKLFRLQQTTSTTKLQTHFTALDPGQPGWAGTRNFRDSHPSLITPLIILLLHKYHWSLPSLCYDPLHHRILIPGLACLSTTSFQVFLGVPLCSTPQPQKLYIFLPNLRRYSLACLHHKSCILQSDVTFCSRYVIWRCYIGQQYAVSGCSLSPATLTSDECIWPFGSRTWHDSLAQPLT